MLIVLVVGIFFAAQKILLKNQGAQILEEINLSFDAEGPYALILPRKDGNALILNITRVSSYDGISYELTYQSDGIDRGVQGNLDTKNRKNEYTQEILFGTCSKGDTFSTRHCVFDKNVENGILALNINQKNKIYKINTTWHLQRPQLADGLITSGDGHFTYKISIPSEKSQAKAIIGDLEMVGFVIVNDLSGAPKIPPGKQILGKVYALNVPSAKMLPRGQVSIELSNIPPSDAQIARFIESKNSWEPLVTQAEGSKMSAETDGAGIFTVLTTSK